jgi:hypothetical protein
VAAAPHLVNGLAVFRLVITVAQMTGRASRTPTTAVERGEQTAIVEQSALVLWNDGKITRIRATIRATARGCAP